jgi:oligopeptide/dipeptide ABC transporter ATP-binding protein
MSMIPLLDVAELSKRYTLPLPGNPVANAFRGLTGARPVAPRLHAVDDVSFTIGRGEIVGLVGESGCGKSTLVRLLSRLLDGTGGSIRFGGKELTHTSASAFARTEERGRIQMVFQDAGESINPRYTAADAIGDPLKRLRGLSGAALKAKVEETALRCGLPLELLGRFPHQLSGGQRARVGIARAVAVQPELLILDEPTAALDVSVQVVILQLLQQLKADLGMGYLFVSHDLNVVRLLCDRVMVMYLGKIVESGPAREVFARPAHPYTRALIAALPDATRAAKDRVRLSGEVRSPIDPDPDACRFLGRCPRGVERCKTAMPLLAERAPGHHAACHFPEVYTP